MKTRNTVDLAIEAQPACESTNQEQATGVAVQPDEAVDQHHQPDCGSTRGGFQFAGLTKPPRLISQRL